MNTTLAKSTFTLAFVFASAFAAADDVCVKYTKAPTRPICLTATGDETDRAAEITAALDQVRRQGGGTILLGPGDYHIATPKKRTFFVSNHDQQSPRNVYFDVHDVRNLRIACTNQNGRARMVADGGGVSALFMDTENVTVENVTFDYKRPYYTVCTVKDKKLVVDPDFTCTTNDNGTIVAKGGDSAKGTAWTDSQNLSSVFDAPTVAGGPAGKNRGGVGQVNVNNTYNYDDGTVIMARSGSRPNPGVVLYRAVDTCFTNSGSFGSGGGMGILCQRSTNITLWGWRTRGTRPIALQADATHFSNCAGHINVQYGIFEGTVDDAINVHSTALQITAIDGDTITCQYKHGQSIGFETFLPGERLRFIKTATFVPGDGEEVVVTAATMTADNRVRLQLAKPVPSAYAVGDAVENADWQPRVTFMHNIVRNNNPRGTLFTTPGKVVCSSNLFLNVHQQTFHFQGDAAEWYESGASRDVVIEGNIIQGCGYGGGSGVFLIDPTVTSLSSQPADKRYHRNILIRNNTFDGCSNGNLVYARSCSNVHLTGNKTLNGTSQNIDQSYAEVVVDDWGEGATQPDLPKE